MFGFHEMKNAASFFLIKSGLKMLRSSLEKNLTMGKIIFPDYLSSPV